MATLAGLHQRFHGRMKKPEHILLSPETELQRELNSLWDSEPDSMMTTETGLHQRLKTLMNKPENMVCCDCSARQPRWASLIVPPQGSPADSLPIGALCCLECSGSHRRLGVHVCYVRSLILDSWKENEVTAMENGGNAKVNAIYEAQLEKSGCVKPLDDANGETRQNYIRDKYEQRMFHDANKMKQYDQSSGDHFILETIQTCSSVEVTIIRETLL